MIWIVRGNVKPMFCTRSICKSNVLRCSCQSNRLFVVYLTSLNWYFKDNFQIVSKHYVLQYPLKDDSTSLFVVRRFQTDVPSVRPAVRTDQDLSGNLIIFAAHLTSQFKYILIIGYDDNICTWHAQSCFKKHISSSRSHVSLLTSEIL